MQVTDKFFHSLAAGVVPVVMGAPNIATFAPSKHSFIRTDKFDSPASLCQYLKHLDTHDDEYRRCFSFFMLLLSNALM